MIVLDEAYDKFKGNHLPKPAYYKTKEPTRDIVKRILRTRDSIAELMMYTNRILYIEHVLKNFRNLFTDYTVLSVGNNKSLPKDVIISIDEISNEFVTLFDGQHQWGRSELNYGVLFQRADVIKVVGIFHEDKHFGFGIAKFKYYGKTLVNSIQEEEQQVLNDLLDDSQDNKYYRCTDDYVQIRDGGMNTNELNLMSLLYEDDVLFNMELDNGSTLERKMLESITGFTSARVDIHHVAYLDECHRMIVYGTEIMQHIFASVSTKILALLEKLEAAVNVYVMQGTSKPLPMQATNGYLGMFETLKYMANNDLQEIFNARMQLNYAKYGKVSPEQHTEL